MENLIKDKKPYSLIEDLTFYRYSDAHVFIDKIDEYLKRTPKISISRIRTICNLYPLEHKCNVSYGVETTEGACVIRKKSGYVINGLKVLPMTNKEIELEGIDEMQEMDGASKPMYYGTNVGSVYF